LSNYYGPRHPKIVEVDTDLSALNGLLTVSVTRALDTIDNNEELLRKRVQSIGAKLDAGKQVLQDLGSTRYQLDALESEAATNRELYLTFFNRMTEIRSADGLRSVNARIAERATPQSQPVKPDKPFTIALAAIGALLVAAVVAFVYEHMDDTIRSVDDIEYKLDARLLGVIPLLKGARKRLHRLLSRQPVAKSSDNHKLIEAFNTVRTNLLADEAGTPRRIIAITSSVPGEGKSTTALNLALSFAQMEKVLLIDADLRRPSIARALGLQVNTPGLTSLISGTSTVSTCTQVGIMGDLDAICSGPATDQPLELLSSAKFADTLKQLAIRYDRVVIDCPPTQAVSDPLVLGPLADTVIYAVKSHQTSYGGRHCLASRL